jgi:hypothetical protein
MSSPQLIRLPLQQLGEGKLSKGRTVKEIKLAVSRDADRHISKFIRRDKTETWKSD